MINRRALWAVIGVSTVLRLAWAASLGGFTNEAYYYMYAQHLDWCYFDHPPMVGIVSALGLKLAGWISPVFGLRVGFIGLFAGSTWLLARLSARSFGDRAGVLAALALNATAYYGLLVGTFAEPDGPLLFFWLLTIDRLSVALEKPERISVWLGLGLAWGGAMLSKYPAVLLLAGAGLYLLVRPSARRCLRMPGPYLAVAAGLALFSPVIGWNATHGWASFAYQGTRAGSFHGFQLTLLIEALIAQVLYLTPWICAGLVAVLIRLARRGPRDWSDSETFLTCQAVPALALFLGVATFKRIMPHWPMIGFVALLPMLGRAWSDRLTAEPRRQWRRLAALTAAPMVMAIVIAAQADAGLLQDGRGWLLGLISPRVDPTVDLIRWDQIASDLKRRGLLDDPETFLFTDNWRFSAQLAMATRQAAPVACYHRDSRSFTFWSRPADWVGRNGIFVRLDDGLVDPAYYTPWFTRVEPLAAIPITRARIPLQTVRLYRFVRQTEPFPFGYVGREPIPAPAPRGVLPMLGHQPSARVKR